MSEMDAVTDLLGGGRTISYKTDLAHMTGSVTAGLLLSQFWYWTNSLPPDRKGWFYKTAEEMQSETGMGRTEAEGARKKLRDLGLVAEERRGVPAKLWYRIDKARLNELLAQYAANKIAENLQTGLHKTRRQDSPEPATLPAESQQTITQNTTQTTQIIQQLVRAQPTRTSEQEGVVVFAATLASDLIALGVAEKVAQGLVKVYPDTLIRQQMAWLPQRHYDDAAATLVESIKQGYGPPATLKKTLPRPRQRHLSVSTTAGPPAPGEDTVEAMHTAVAEARKKVRGAR